MKEMKGLICIRVMFGKPEREWKIKFSAKGAMGECFNPFYAKDTFIQSTRM